MQELLHNIVENPVSSVLLIFNLITVECLLSVDYEAMHGLMGIDLPSNERIAARKHGLSVACLSGDAISVFSGTAARKLAA
ncbi:MAG: hypothetical protein HGB22_05765 [Chlorobiaceae bacterium]|nr:hypothetical protein [Chlorobiaceae bacterium]